MIRRPPSSPLFPYTPRFRSAPSVPPPAADCSLTVSSDRSRPRLPRLSGRTIPWPPHLPDACYCVTAEDRPPIRSVHDDPATRRSEEHTSELQSQSNLVCRLL